MGDLGGIRILVAGVKLPPETFLVRLFNGLEERGADVTIASGDAASPGAKWKHISTSRLLRASRWAWAIGSFSRKWDLMYFPWNSSAAQLGVAFLGKHACIVSCRGAQINIAPHNPRRNDFVRQVGAALAKASIVHCVSADIQEKAVALGAPSERCRLIYPAVDTRFFTPPASRSSNRLFRIAMVGTPIWRKGYEYALIGFRGLVDAGVHAHLDIVGFGNEMQRVIFTIADLGLEGYVTLRGAMKPHSIRALLQETDVLLHTSLSEGISNGVLEGMACALPVVCTDAGGMREAVRDGVDGLVIPVRDPAAVTGALAWLARNEVERTAMGVSGRERTLKLFTLDEQIAKWVTTIHEALELAGQHS
jgi:glycosyltransferase involved in cell wall biosynthesis